MKKAILLSLLFSLVFCGCSQKEAPIVFQDKLVCTEQQKLEKIEPVQIRIYNDDVEVAKAYKTAIDSNIEFYEKQIDRNNILCKENK
jgi:PBP1b-binding outer membrane lipoprotein LpoB